MLEKLPSVVGRMLEGARPGVGRLTFNDAALAGVPGILSVTSPAFPDRGRIPTRHTADGEGTSPPLEWHDVPPGTAAVVLLVEDADSPTPNPLVHAIVCDLPGADGALRDGELPSPAGKGESHRMGRNSYWRAAYLPPDPPPGHGPHRYAFQLYALDAAPAFNAAPRRGKLISALRGHVLAKGCLIGTYERA